VRRGGFRGVGFGDDPALTFEDTGVTDLREQAVARVEDLTAPDGLFEDLLESLDLDEDPGEKIDEAREMAQGALDELYTGDDDAAVSNGMKSAVDELVNVLDEPGEADPEDIRAAFPGITG
jgi:hypothetical protein